MSILAALLEIAIVLAAIYVTMSCVCSAINEQIAQILKLRGEKLYQGVLNLLVGHRALTDAIFVHPMIAASSDDKDGAISRKTYRPPYVDARNFSMAFWQSVQLQQALPSDADMAAIMRSSTSALDDLALRVHALPAGDLQRSLTALINAANGDYEKLLAATDGWFNAQMDRVSGWYKRQTQAILALIAASIVIVSGIDSIEIGTRLYFDQGLRQSVVDAIVKSLPAPAGSAEGAGANGATEKTRAMSGVAQTIDGQLQGQLGTFFHPPNDWLSHLRHVPGMAVTFVALLLGGPFWFDALCGLVNVRAVGRRPQRADQPPR